MKGIKDKKGKFATNLKTRECGFCLQSFKPRLDRQKFCNKKCEVDSKRKNHTRDCVKCGQAFTAQNMKTRFCSHTCYGESLVKEKFIIIKQKYVRKIINKSCGNCGINFCVNPARSKTARFCGKVCQGRYFSGEKSCHYKKDRNLLVKKQERNDVAYKEWRKQVWLRDKFMCKIANPDCQGRLEAHHILGWASHPELRYEVNNGITLCHFHHPRKRKDEMILSPFFQELVSVKGQ